MAETKLGAYYDSMGTINDTMNRVERFGYFSPFDFDRIEALIDEATNNLCESFKDGSFTSRRLYA